MSLDQPSLRRGFLLGCLVLQGCMLALEPGLTSRPDVAPVDAGAVDAPDEEGIDVVDAPADDGGLDLVEVPSDTGGMDVVDARADVGSEPGDVGVDRACPTGLTRCGAICVDLQVDLIHCGSCTTSCGTRPEAITGCVMGMCRRSCTPGHADCDGEEANGCEVDTATDPAHCSACDTLCEAGTTCTGGRCVSVCAGGRTWCRGECVDTTSDARHCGMCNNPCLTGASCEGSRCTVVCFGARIRCGESCVDPLADASNCGACGHLCLPGQICSGGACGCLAPLVNCSGACVDLATNPGHCGGCARPCAMGTTCVGGTCVTPCLGTTSPCYGGCVNTSLDPANCGGCGVVCPQLPHAEVGCMGGRCAITTCRDTWSDCDGVAANGCEANLQTSFTNCGTCGHACGSSAVCSSGSCRSVCLPGTESCSGNCVQRGFDPDHCGVCGNRCGGPHVVDSLCSGGGCVPGRCETGWADCNIFAGDGCEVNVWNNPTSCGGCGGPCAGTCVGGRCLTGVTTCAAPLAICGGRCSNPESDRLNCGTCGHACLPTQVCRARTCTWP